MWWKLLILIMVGCGQEQKLHFRYTGDEAGYVQSQLAAKAWRDACGVDIQVSRTDGEIPLIQVVAEDLGSGSVEHVGSRAAAVTTIGKEGVVSIMFAKDDVRGTEEVMHELGHALGLGHLDHGIMAHTSIRTSADVRVTTYECEEVGKL